MIGSDVFTIGVDIGTTSTKAAVFDHSGQVKGRHAVGYPLRTTALGAAEQDPDVIYTAVLENPSAAPSPRLTSRPNASGAPVSAPPCTA